MLLCNTFILLLVSCLCGSENQVLMISEKNCFVLHVHPLKWGLSCNVLVAPNVVKSIVNLVLPLVIS